MGTIVFKQELGIYPWTVATLSCLISEPCLLLTLMRRGINV